MVHPTGIRTFNPRVYQLLLLVLVRESEHRSVKAQTDCEESWSEVMPSATKINTSSSALKCKVSVFLMQGSWKGQQIKPHHLQLQELCRWRTIMQVSNMEVFPARNLYTGTSTVRDFLRWRCCKGALIQSR